MTDKNINYNNTPPPKKKQPTKDIESIVKMKNCASIVSRRFYTMVLVLRRLGGRHITDQIYPIILEMNSLAINNY